MRLFALILALLWVPASATTYFADDGATGANDGTSIGDAFTTLKLGMETIGASDSLIVCPSHAETLSSTIAPTADGTAADPIVVIKDDGTHWPDSSGTPTLTCNAYYISLATDDYWAIQGLRFDAASVYCIKIQSCISARIRNCQFTNIVAGADYGVYVATAQEVEISDCIFDGGTDGVDDGNVGIMIAVTSALVRVTNVSVEDAARALQVSGGTIYIRNSDLGQPHANTNDFYVLGHGAIYGIDVAHTTSDDGGHSDSPGGTKCHFVNLDANKRPILWSRGENASIDSDYAVVHSGGADYSLKVSAQTIEAASIMMPWEIMSVAVHADSAESRDYTIYGYRDANFPAPTAANLYLEVLYSDADSVKTAVSTQVLTNASEWYALTVSGISPNHAFPVTCRLVLKTWDADGYLYFDPRLVATGETYHETLDWGLPDLAYFYQAVSGQIIMIY